MGSKSHLGMLEELHMKIPSISPNSAGTSNSSAEEFSTDDWNFGVRDEGKEIILYISKLFQCVFYQSLEFFLFPLGAF